MKVDYHFGEDKAAHARRVGEYVAQQNALDAPFESLKRERAIARMDAKARFSASSPARVSAPGAAPALGLVSNETKGTSSVEKFEIDPAAKRIKRMRNGVQHAARLIDFECAQGDVPMVRKFLTFTYADANGWSPDDFNKFRRRLVEWCKRKGYTARGVWVAELQTGRFVEVGEFDVLQGVLHYHLVLWLPVWAWLPTPDRRMPGGGKPWWPHGSTNIQTARSPIGYISKYASKTTKEHALRYPKGARMFGAFGVDPEMRRHLRYWQAPFFVRDALTGRADIRKVRGGYADRITGAFCASPWVVEVRPDGRVFAYRKKEISQ